MYYIVATIEDRRMRFSMTPAAEHSFFVSHFLIIVRKTSINFLRPSFFKSGRPLWLAIFASDKLSFSHAAYRRLSVQVLILLSYWQKVNQIPTQTTSKPRITLPPGTARFSGRPGTRFDVSKQSRSNFWGPRESTFQVQHEETPFY